MKLLAASGVVFLTSLSALAQDSVAPNSPTQLASSAVTEKSLTLTWRDNSTNEDGFELRRSGGSSAVTTLSKNITSYVDNKGLSAGTQYSYSLLSYRLKKGKRNYSNPVSLAVKTSAPVVVVPPPPPKLSRYSS